MIDLIGYWGNVTVLTVVLLLPLLYISKVLLSHITLKITGDSSIAERVGGYVIGYREGNSPLEVGELVHYSDSINSLGSLGTCQTLDAIYPDATLPYMVNGHRWRYAKRAINVCNILGVEVEDFIPIVGAVIGTILWTVYLLVVEDPLYQVVSTASMHITEASGVFFLLALAYYGVIIIGKMVWDISLKVNSLLDKGEDNE